MTLKLCAAKLFKNKYFSQYFTKFGTKAFREIFKIVITVPRIEKVWETSIHNEWKKKKLFAKKISKLKYYWILYHVFMLIFQTLIFLRNDLISNNIFAVNAQKEQCVSWKKYSNWILTKKQTRINVLKGMKWTFYI
jgi:hypothetical protein